MVVHGKRPNKARQASEEEEEILWKSGKLVGRLNNSMNCSAHFCGLQTVKNIEKNIVLTARVMIFVAFEQIIFARSLRC